jgi:hypothetical protein
MQPTASPCRATGEVVVNAPFESIVIPMDKLVKSGDRQIAGAKGRS